MEETVQQAPVVIRWIHRIVNGIFIVSMIGTVAMVFVASGGDSTYVTWGFAIIWLYAMVAALSLAVVLLFHAAVTRTVSLLKWPFMLFALSYLFFIASGLVVRRLSGRDTVWVRVVNDSGVLIEVVNIFGRGDEVQLINLAEDSSAVVLFRGRESDDRARNSYSNRVAVDWVAAGKRHERVVVGEWDYINDSMIIVFPRADSVLVTLPRETPILK